MQYVIIRQDMEYDGSQLRPHWIYDHFELLGDAAVAFCGMALQSAQEMVDVSDVKDKEGIFSPYMLHFIIEHFGSDLELAIYRQRIFLSLIKDELARMEIYPQRIGDRLYLKQAKLSVSTATLSNISSLIHVGLNVQTDDTPVRAVGLEELGVRDVLAFAERVLVGYKHELEGIYESRCRVRGV